MARGIRKVYGGTVTMHDIAAQASVSQTTVSFVLNGRTDRANISPETRDRVLAVARELGYQRNQLARAMVTGKSRILGVLTAPSRGENFVRVLAGAQEAASQHDYLLKVQHFSGSTVDESAIAHCLEWRLAGAVVVGLGEYLQEELYARLSDWKINLVTVDNARRYKSSLHVSADNEGGVRQAVQHLIERGHQRIAFIGGGVSFLSHEREQSFRATLADAGLPVHESWICHSSWHDAAVIREKARAVLDAAADRPTAIVCASDVVAMVLFRVARARGLRVPEDLSVTGFTNSALSEYADPPLTTVEQPFHEMGYAAVMHLIKSAESSEVIETDPTPLRLPTRLIVRASTAPVSITKL